MAEAMVICTVLFLASTLLLAGHIEIRRIRSISVRCSYG